MAALLAAAIGAAGSARGQAYDDIDALNRQVVALAQASKFDQALPLAQRSIALSKARHGEDSWRYAIAVNILAELLRDTKRLAEAEPLFRRALAIFEKSLGPNDSDVAIVLNNLAGLLRATNRLAEAEPLYRRAIAIDAKSYGYDHPEVAAKLWRLAGLLQASNRLAEAEPLYRRALAIYEKSYGSDHPTVASLLGNLAGLLQSTSRFAEAEPLFRRALAIDEKRPGPNLPTVAIRLNNLASLLYATNRLAEAEPLLRRALAIDEKSYGHEHPNVAGGLNNLAELLRDTNRPAEAERLLRRALTIYENSLEPDHPNVATGLNNLASLLRFTNRLAEAEPLFRRALSIDEKGLGPDHPSVASNASNLALLLQDTNRRAEAELLFRRALAIDERLGADDPSVARDLNNLAGLLQVTDRLAEAVPLHRRALAIYEKSLGPDHPNVARSLNNLGALLHAANLLIEAEPLFRRALTTYEKSFVPDHPEVALSLNHLAVARAERGDWDEAVRLHRRAIPIMTGARGRNGGSPAKAALIRNSRELRVAARAVRRAGGDSAAARAEGFELAQWALQTGAADALSQMSVRFAKGGGSLAAVVRQRQDLLARHEGEDKRLLMAIGRGDAKEAAALRSAITGLDAQLGAIDRRLDAEFPEYASLASPKPLAIAAVQRLLKDDEALMAFLDVPGLGRLLEETLAWAVTRTEARWISIPLGTRELAERVARLRCGLDREGNWAWNQQRRRWEAKDARCRALRPDGLAEAEALPFDVATAHELYAALLAPFADMTRGKSLLIVPSGPLTSLPLHVLVAGDTPGHDVGATVSDPQGLTPWLALKQPITLLPSVGSLQALRRLPPSKAKEPYVAFGNPLLDGDPQDADHREWAKLARARQSCPLDLETLRQHVVAAARSIPVLGAAVRGGGVNVAALRAQTPLPETADELCRVAKALGALGRERETVWLGARASEGNLKALSRAGKLARYRVLHFATHGLLAGESEAILKAKAEPALILNPPKDGATQAELEEDDGLLTASEVAQLDLDADWVVLSACNTAAGENGNAEALAGLARAFFYAKARALLVSHWSADSDTGVKLTTNAFAEIAASPRIGRAEALRRSMAGLIQAGGHEAQPEYWAPFVLVGEGAR